MRIKINRAGVVSGDDFGTLQTWVEEHPDNVADSFIATSADHNDTPICFQFQYGCMLGCHRLFMYDPINDTIISFFAEDFTDIGKWVFDTCYKAFPRGYEIYL